MARKVLPCHTKCLARSRSRSAWLGSGIRQAEGRMLPGKKHIGRPAVTGLAELAALRGLIADGKSVTEATRILKIGRSTAYAALAAT